VHVSVRYINSSRLSYHSGLTHLKVKCCVKANVVFLLSCVCGSSGSGVIHLVAASFQKFMSDYDIIVMPLHVSRLIVMHASRDQ
jgi:hypothetical protein